MEIEKIRQELRMYRAVDNDLRLRAYDAIDRQPGISFNELSRQLKIERGLLAYHLGVLKASGLINVSYERRSKETSKYELTEEGKEFLKQLAAGAKSKEGKK